MKSIKDPYPDIQKKNHLSILSIYLFHSNDLNRTQSFLQFKQNKFNSTIKQIHLEIDQ